MVESLNQKERGYIKRIIIEIKLFIQLNFMNLVQLKSMVIEIAILWIRSDKLFGKETSIYQALEDIWCYSSFYIMPVMQIDHH